MKYAPACCLVIALFALGSCTPQQPSISLANPSFEDTPKQGRPPTGWKNCNDKITSPVDVQPGSFGVTLPAFEGNSYVSMVVRVNNSLEGISQMLARPLTPNIAYSLSLPLAMSGSFSSSAFDANRQLYQANFSNPVVLRLYAGLKPCERRQLLAETPPVSHHEWKNYELIFAPSGGWTHLMLETFYNTTRAKAYNGHILVDGAYRKYSRYGSEPG